MKVWAGTITSAPGSSPLAISASRSASSPLAAPTQAAVWQYVAKDASNSATSGPLMNRPLSMSAEMSASISSFRPSIIGPPSKNGTERELSVSSVVISLQTRDYRVPAQLADRLGRQLVLVIAGAVRRER